MNYGDDKTTARMFENRLEIAKNNEKRATLVSYLEWSITAGQRATDIMEVLSRYKKWLDIEES